MTQIDLYENLINLKKFAKTIKLEIIKKLQNMISIYKYMRYKITLFIRLNI